MTNLDCKIVGIKKSGRCVFTRREGIEVYALIFDGKPITVDVKKLRDYLDYKAEELDIDIYIDVESTLEVLSDNDVMTA